MRANALRTLAHRRIEVGVEQPGRFVLCAGEQVPVAVERDATLACPMNVLTAFALTQPRSCSC